MTEPLTDEEFEELYRDRHMEHAKVQRLIATVENWKGRYSIIEKGYDLINEENAKLNERLLVKQKINEDQNAYILKLKAELAEAK